MSLGMKLRMHWAWWRGRHVLVHENSYLTFNTTPSMGWVEDLRAKGWTDWKPGWIR